MLNLNEIREQIDGIDRQMIALYEERMKLCEAVANFKVETGKKVLDTDREKEKLEAVAAMVKEEKNMHDVRELFAQIMAMSRKMQYRLMEERGLTLREPYETVDTVRKENCRVVYQGVPGAYSHIAAKRFFGSHMKETEVETWQDAMEAVKRGQADYAVLPIENSTTGIIAQVYDLLQEYHNYIVAEVYVKVEHALLGLPGTELEEVKAVYSHPQGFLQCQKYLKSHKDWELISQANTAGSAKKVLEGSNGSCAAIASEEAAVSYHLQVLERSINDSDNNTTRFVIVSNKRIFVKDADKISISFEANNEQSSLYHLLSHISYNGLNMSKIESRPIEGREWEFRFFIDFEGNIDDAPVKNALRGIEEEANYIKFLGNY